MADQIQGETVELGIDEFSLTTAPIDLYFNEQPLTTSIISSPAGTSSQAGTRIPTSIS
jgi:hypothetical protein